MNKQALTEALDDMVWQFAYRTVVDGKRALSTGGLSALELAFDALGWDDPHICADGGCEIIGCNEWATCVGKYPRHMGNESNSMNGFGYLCGNHYRQFNGSGAVYYQDMGRLE